MLNLTTHAMQRIYERNITDDELAAALCGRRLTVSWDRAIWYDNNSKTVVVINPRTQDIITTYRATRQDVKRSLSR